MGDVHAVDELRLAREVDVVGPRPRAGGDQRLAVVDVRPDGGDDDLRGLGDRADRVGVGDVRVQQRDVDVEALAQRLELAAVAAREGPARALARVGGEVLGGQRAGVTGGAEEDDVVLGDPGIIASSGRGA
jgi:hypothetical protein